MIELDSRGRTLVDIDTGTIHSGVLGVTTDLNTPAYCEDTMLILNMDKLIQKLEKKPLLVLGYVIKIAYLLREGTNELHAKSSTELYEYLDVSRVTGSRIKKELVRAGVLNFDEDTNRIYLSPELFHLVRRREYAGGVSDGI